MYACIAGDWGSGSLTLHPITRVLHDDALHVFAASRAFPPCCGPLWLSPPGQAGDPEVWSSVPPFSARRIEQRVMRRTLSAYPAFQCLPAARTAGPQTVVALGISPTSLPTSRRHLPPFPLYTAFPCAEYYGSAVALRLAARRAIPHSLSARRVERDVGGPFAPARGVMLPRPLCGRFGRTPISRPITEAPPVDVVAEDGCLHPWRLSFVQCSSRPIVRVLQDEVINVF
jgi:hypothetical protein